MKICLKGDDFREDLYDRDNGDGAAMLVIDSLRLTGDVNNEIIQKIHKDGLTQAALQAIPSVARGAGGVERASAWGRGVDALDRECEQFEVGR